MAQTFVLVHGAWQTAATWDLIKPRLEADGHEVIVPLLSGLELTGPPLDETVDLDTHIDDIVRLLPSGRDIVLVGHSYAGMIITAVAHRAPVRRLIYIDAFIPDDGQSVLDLMPGAIAQMFRDQAAAHGDGWRLKAGEGQLDLGTERRPCARVRPGASQRLQPAMLRAEDSVVRCTQRRTLLHRLCRRRLSRARRVPALRRPRKARRLGLSRTPNRARLSRRNA